MSEKNLGIPAEFNPDPKTTALRGVRDVLRQEPSNFVPRWLTECIRGPLDEYVRRCEGLLEEALENHDRHLLLESAMKLASIDRYLQELVCERAEAVAKLHDLARPGVVAETLGVSVDGLLSDEMTGSVTEVDGEAYIDPQFIVWALCQQING